MGASYEASSSLRSEFVGPGPQRMAMSYPHRGNTAPAPRPVVAAPSRPATGGAHAGFPVSWLPIGVTAPWWYVGCHGGAGTSTLALATAGGADAGRHWPVSREPGGSSVVLVTRDHAAGLRAAQGGALQWASGAPVGVSLLGLAVVASAPGRRPKPLRDLIQLVAGAFQHVWELPWVEPLRLGDPADQIDLPPAFTGMAADLCSLTTGDRRV